MNDAMETIFGIGGIWYRVCGLFPAQQVPKKATREVGVKERLLAGAFTEEQRRRYDDAERDSQAAIEEIRKNGEQRCEAIFKEKQEESIRKLILATPDFRRNHG